MTAGLFAARAARRFVMIRVVMFDLGNTLLRESDRTLFPHVLPALHSIEGFVTEDGQPLERCIGSNFPAQVPVPPQEVEQAFQQFVGILEKVGLAALFQPAARRVTISAQVGVAKPNRAFFEGALVRLGLAPNLDTCLFVTEEEDHIRRAAALGMQTLRFGGHQSPPAGGADFSDWAEAPALIAARVTPGRSPNLAAAVRAYLETAYGLSDMAVTPPAQEGDPYRAEAQARVPLSDAALGGLSGVNVDLPVRPAVWVSASGHITRVEGTAPPASDRDEATQYVLSLVSNGQVADLPGQSPLGPTHRVELDASGRRLLTRKRFTAC
jgi:hypothetical protein